MAFPNVAVQDTFTGSDLTVINGTGPWQATRPFGSGADCVIRSNAASGGAGAGIATTSESYSRATNTLEIAITRSDIGSSNASRIWLAWCGNDAADTTPNEYELEVGNGQIQVYRITNGAGTVILTVSTTTSTNGDQWGASHDAAGLITVYKNGTSIGTVSDSTYNTGYFGFYLENSTQRYDDVRFGEVVVAGGTVRLLASTGVGT